MPFCANCGAQVGDNDKFCASCGATRVPGAPAGQPVTPPPPPQPQYQAPPPAYSAPAGGYQTQPGMQPMGAPQAGANAGESSTGLKANIAGLLCYLAGWITGIIFFVLEKKSHFVKFHAAQSLVVFGALSIVSFVLNFIPFVRWLNLLLGLLGLFLWVFLMYKAYQGEAYKLPIAGDIADGIVGKV
jgi:uncharacterized membrane protein